MKTPMGSAESGENDALLIDAAAAHGIDIVRWLHEKRSTSCSSLAVNDTAESGYVEIVKYMLKNRSEGCTRAAIQGAASYGHFKALKYIVESGFASCVDPVMESPEIDKEETEFRPMGDAVQLGHLHVVRFLFEHCHLRCSESAMSEARYTKYFAVLEWVL